ncbi:RecQ family ATP-dependent DNA helicase [Neobacillus sp. MM2021_6]|uniref:RecQ family ATP-dependent DNA helicase n=1 Tax=Bacillaceae TaxID=186817 RepID=UPI00140E62A1|nr:MULTISPECIES: ATP-dependent DNA helicase RecQ [Bacillaceae]MBO0958120.1 RecQ family ATP-dependent DNA helicase [Neobacillus sp. MM2021_6]NHC18456.1 RecQ family ATP-dependent DNA helicase [Bacillus sp. MM2020_4]
MEIESLLKKHFGYSSFKTGQKEVISSVLAGKHTLAMLPTGTGKTLCYQLPGLILPGQTLIISPLLSLMQDQVEQFKRFGEKRVIALNSFLSPSERNNVLRHLKEYKFIFISPEMLRVPYIIRMLQQLTISLFVVDEAHCISQWGYDFRPDYSKLGAIREKLGDPVTLALTATATSRVLDDISLSLELEEVVKIVSTIDRPNIAFHIEKLTDYHHKQDRVIDLVARLQKPGIIYFSSKKAAEQMAALLDEKGICRAMAYHGGVDQNSRILIQQQFIHNQLDVICATSAFGMGINKENIRFIIHYHMPMQMESYLQEIGRAGRDGNPSVAILLYAPGDEQLPLQLAEGELPSEQQIDWFFAHVQLEETLPDGKTEFSLHLKELGGFSDSQWRIMEEFVLAPTKMVSSPEKVKTQVKEFVKERLEAKFNHIFLMKRWVESLSCRREFILGYFDERLPNKVSSCCDVCGLELNGYQSAVKTPFSMTSEEKWKDYLAKILVNSGLSE